MMATVLIVDDEKSFRETVKIYLSGRGHRVIEAEDGGKAMRVLETNETDLVITDLMMPDRDGFEMIVEVRKSFPEIPVIAVSGGGLMPAAD